MALPVKKWIIDFFVAESLTYPPNNKGNMICVDERVEVIVVISNMKTSNRCSKIKLNY